MGHGASGCSTSGRRTTAGHLKPSQSFLSMAMGPQGQKSQTNLSRLLNRGWHFLHESVCVQGVAWCVWPDQWYLSLPHCGTPCWTRGHGGQWWGRSALLTTSSSLPGWFWLWGPCHWLFMSPDWNVWKQDCVHNRSILESSWQQLHCAVCTTAPKPPSSCSSKTCG